MPWRVLKRLVLRTIQGVRRDYLTRAEKARRIRTIRRTVRWGKR